jgi:protein ImuB
MDSLTAPEPAPLASPQAVRRIFFHPNPFQPPPLLMSEKNLPHGSEQAQMARMSGPYVVSGGWWKRHVHREYYFTETHDGELLWVYDDRIRQRWYTQGRVE